MNPSFPSRNISFRVETMFSGKGNRVGRIKPDENGIYKGLPMMTLGETTQNNTYYDPASVVDQITNPNTAFNMVFKSQKLYGEYSHPLFIGLSNEDKLARLCLVDENNASHLFTGIYTDSPSADGTVVVRADIKPTGPKGAVFKESLDDPVVNTAFSLRAFVDTTMRPNGLKHRTVRKLVTWDTVGASGYTSTDKAHAIGLESFAGDTFSDYEITVMNDGNLIIDQIALESYSDMDINEIFGSSKISKIIQSRTFVKVDDDLSQKFPNLYKKTIFNEFFKEG